jgi:imidazolonepropionase-like amidohydrolase
MGVEDVIRGAFNDAKAYQRKWADYKANPNGPPLRRDLKLEPLVEVLEGRRLVHAHCYRADEILMLLRVAEEFGFKIKTLQHVLEGYKVSKEIAAHGAGASTFSDWWSYKVEAYDAIPHNAAIMVRKGVLVSLNSDSAELMRHLNTEAAKAMKYGGLNENEALSLVTINPAKQLDLDHRIGSIETGKDADLVIYDKHPLSNFAKVQKVLIDGEVYFDRDTDLSGRAEKAARKKVLVDKYREEQKKQMKKGPPERKPA